MLNPFFRPEVTVKFVLANLLGAQAESPTLARLKCRVFFKAGPETLQHLGHLSRQDLPLEKGRKEKQNSTLSPIVPTLWLISRPSPSPPFLPPTLQFLGHPVTREEKKAY